PEDRLGLQLRPGRPEHRRREAQGRVERVRDPGGRAAVHDHPQRRGHQRVGELAGAAVLPCGRPADRPAPVRARLHRPAEPRERGPHRVPRRPGGGPVAPPGGDGRAGRPRPARGRRRAARRRPGAGPLPRPDQPDRTSRLPEECTPMERRTSPGGTRRRGARRFLAATVAGLTATTVLTVAPASAAPAGTAAPSAVTSVADATVAAEQVLTWTADNSVTDYKTFPATAEAGPATIVFENSMATGSTFGMSHTLTFDTGTIGYNHDVDLNILASPFDANGGRHEAQVTLTAGTYRYFCAIPGHGEMWGELVVTDGGGGGGTTAPSVTAQVTGEQDGDGAYVGGATVTLTATDDDSGVAGVEYDLDGAGWQAYTEPVVVDAVGAHTLQFRATDAAGNTSEAQTATFTVVEGDVEEDTTAPVVEPMLMGEQDEDGAYVGTAAFMLHATDEGSGVASVEYQVDGGAWLPYTTTVPFTELGEHTVAYRATDVAGNVSEGGTVTCSVVAGGEEDTPAPTVTAEVAGEQDDNGAFVGSATATLTATDDASGVESVEYDLDGAGWAAYTEPL